MQSFGLYCSGAVHTVIFAGFAPEAVAARINDSKAKVVFTADEAVRGNNSRTCATVMCANDCKYRIQYTVSRHIFQYYTVLYVLYIYIVSAMYV